MMKKMISWFLVLAMVLSLVPVVATAETVIKTDKAGTHTADHICEECGAAFTEWTSNNSLPGAGHYYLTKDVTLTKEISVTGELHLCLNGFVVKAAAGKRLLSTKDNTATELVITDCTAYTDAEGVYHAGALTGGQDASAGGGAVFVRKMGVMKVYDGRITQNTSTVAGGAIALQAKSGTAAGAKLYMYGGELSDNTAIKADGTYKNGGAIYTGSGCIAELENVTIQDNTAIAGGAIYTGAMGGTIKLKNCVIEGNTATGTEGGGAIYSTYASFQLTDCQLLGNKSPSGGGGLIYSKTSGEYELINCTVKGNEGKTAGGAIRLQDKVNLTVTGSTFMENKSGSGGSVIYYQNYCQVSLKDTTITGNVGTSNYKDGYSAAIYGVGGASKLTIGGKMIVADNSIASPNTADINFNNADTDILFVEGLSAGSRVFFSTKATPNAAASDLVSGAPVTWDYNWVTYMDENGQLKMIGYEDGKFVFSDGHKHKPCGDESCTDHEAISFKAWTDSTALPASGSWYLDTDVTLSKEVGLKTDLNLCLNGHTITGKTASMRIFSTSGAGGETLTICDCTAKTVDGVYTAGKLTGSHNTNAGAGGGAIFLRAGGELRLFDGIICDNSTVAGGGAIYANKATIEIYSGEFSGNYAKNAEGTWKTGGAIYLQDTNMVMYGGTVTGNEANDGSGIHLSGASSLDIRGGKVTGNIAHKEGAGVNVASAASNITVSGNVQIHSNTLADGKASNLRLRSGRIMTVGTVDSQTRIGVNATAFQPISGQTGDYTANFFSDDTRLQVIYQDGALYLEAGGDHKHCLCGGNDPNGCDHKAKTFAAWEDPTSLPNSGNFYLTVDVILTKRTDLQNGTLNLCLNGHTIRVGDQGGRIFRMYSGAHLALTDCTDEPGKLTGATQGAILSDNAGTDMSIDIWHVIFTENHSKSSGGAIIAQSDTTVNFYSGKIINNSAFGYLKLDEAGKPIVGANGDQTYVNCYGAAMLQLGGTFNMYGGEISGNKTAGVAIRKADGSTAYGGGQGGGLYIRGQGNIYGGVIKDNEAQVGGGIYANGSGTVVKVYNAQITGNKAFDMGAGIYASANTTAELYTGTVISNNVTPKLGAGAAASGKNAKILIDGATITGNQAKNAGGIYSQSYAIVELKQGKISDNFATDAGGGVYSATNATFIMSGGSVSGNSSKGDVGGVMCLRGTAKITGGTISNNVGANAAGLCIYGTQATISGLSVTGNRATGKPTVNATTGKTTYSGGNSGGIMIRNASLRGVAYTSVVYASGLYVANNQSNTAAGGLLIQSAGAQLYLSNSTFTGNESATSDAGAIYTSTGTKVQMKNITVTNNKAARAAGMNLYSSTVDIDGLKMNGNSARGAGGALAVAGAGGLVRAKNVEIYENEATSGGAVVVQSNGNLILEDSKLYNNKAKSNGGAAYFNSPSTATMKNVEIFDNNAGEIGGALFVYANAMVTLEDVTVRENTASKNGGGIFSRGRLVATGSKFLNNTGMEGGAIATGICAGDTVNEDAGAFLTDCIFTGNQASAQGGAIYNHRGGPVYLENSTVTENTAGTEGGAIYSNGRLGLTDVTVTGNTGTYAIYVTATEFDGHSYTTGHKKLGGTVIVKDNQGGDLYLQENALMTVVGEQLGEKTHVAVTLENGYLTRQILGVYGYTGGEGQYVITAGDRSITEPEQIPETEQSQPEKQSDVLLYAAIGAAGLLTISAAVLLVMKKKKSAGAEAK